MPMELIVVFFIVYLLRRAFCRDPGMAARIVDGRTGGHRDLVDLRMFLLSL